MAKNFRGYFFLPHTVYGERFIMQGDLVFVKGLLIKGFEVRDKVRTYLKQVGVFGMWPSFYVTPCILICALTDNDTLLFSPSSVNSFNCVVVLTCPSGSS